MYPDVNYIAVLVAGLIPMLVGSVWYGPLFGKKWMELMDLTEEEIKASFNPAKSYGVTLVFALVTSFVLVHVLNAWSDAYGVSGSMVGIQGAFWMWLGFVVTISWQQVAFSGQKLELWLLNISYNLVTLCGMGALLGAWR